MGGPMSRISIRQFAAAALLASAGFFVMSLGHDGGGGLIALSAFAVMSREQRNTPMPARYIACVVVFALVLVSLLVAAKRTGIESRLQPVTSFLEKPAVLLPAWLLLMGLFVWRWCPWRSRSGSSPS